MTPKTGSERQLAYRERRKAEGWKQKLMWFSPEAQRVLESLPDDQNIEQFVNDLIVSQNLTKPDI
jgi:hypothetical protein